MGVLIDQILAQQIVDATHQVIEKDINFINIEGMIIASTNPNRMGQFHEAGYGAIQAAEVKIVDSNTAYEGAQKGVNLPILIDGDVYGVIGITGEPKEVLKYGFLATKITEVLIKDKEMSSHVETRQQMIASLMSMCMSEKKVSSLQLSDILSHLNINEDDRYCCVCIELNKYHLNQATLQSRLRNIIESYQIELFSYTYPNLFTFILSEQKWEHVVKNKETLQNIGKEVVWCGIGDFEPITNIQQSFTAATIALKYCKQYDLDYMRYENLDFELLVEDMKETTKQKYIKKMISLLDDEDIEFLTQYYQCNLSLKETAETMFIHKNTVQYRLERIYRKTRINPRVFNESALLYLAIKLKKLK
ncbi:MAG TPA: hypothetical protein DCY20_05545 [Firmicutes bacterium]|nr:hypothetical protein [Bacillota bacterium]